MTRGRRLGRSFFAQPDPRAVARALVGKHLFTRFEGEIVGGAIVETEAYAARGDASLTMHLARRPEASRALFGPPGRAYVYVVQGGNVLFNITCGPTGTPDAVLVRAALPTLGLDVMKRRNGFPRSPGLLARAFGIGLAAAGESLVSREGAIWIEDRGASPAIDALPRIGLAYAGPRAARLRWRFRARDAGDS